VLAAASVCALVLVVSLAAFSQAAGGGRTVITVVEHGTDEAEADSDGDGADSSGDVFWFSNPVYDDSDNKVVGHDLGSCIRIDPSAGSWQCTWTTFLADGQLVVSGPFYDTRSSVLAILGGTGLASAPPAACCSPRATRITASSSTRSPSGSARSGSISRGVAGVSPRPACARDR
jgi:allene oxide cyclase